MLRLLPHHRKQHLEAITAAPSVIASRSYRLRAEHISPDQISAFRMNLGYEHIKEERTTHLSTWSSRESMVERPENPGGVVSSPRPALLPVYIDRQSEEIHTDIRSSFKWNAQDYVPPAQISSDNPVLPARKLHLHTTGKKMP